MVDLTKFTFNKKEKEKKEWGNIKVTQGTTFFLEIITTCC